MRTTIAIIALICLGSAFAACPEGQANLSPTICVSCATEVSLGCTACTLNPNTCTACGAGFVLDGTRCKALDVTCAKPLCDISGTQGCEECATGYRFAMKDTAATSYCVACTQGNCASCTVDACTACRPGFVLENNACVACSAGCAECSAAATCTRCAAGYFGTATCTACSAGCAECTDAATCTKCATGNVMAKAGNACVAKEGCTEGTGTDDEKCKTCAMGYRLLADGTCTKCTGNAQTCSGSGTDQVIGECNVGLIKAAAVADPVAKEACQTRAQTVCLKQTADGKCQQCPTNWVVSKGACVTTESLATGCKASSVTAGDATTDAKCTECDTARGFVEQANPTGACALCSTGCETCTASACTKCRNGYYLSGTSCTDCAAGGATTCTLRDATECSAGYGKQKHGVCKACDPTYNCATCEEYQKCKTCATGSDVQTTSTAATAATLNKCNVCDANCAASSCPAGPGTCAGATAGSECKTGYKLNTITAKCVKTCESKNCQTCETNDYGKCNTCNDGFYKDSTSQCVACLNTNCKTCADGTTCSACKNGYALKANPSGQFCTVACTVAGGITNGIANLEQCTTDGAASPAFTVPVCNRGFGTGGTATCEACADANCAACAVKATCDTCKDGFHTTSGCTACAGAKELTCSSATVATTCKPGNCLGGGTAQCYTCPVNCKVGSATVLVAGITGDGICPAGQCADGWTEPVASTAGVCVQCTVSNCKVCAVATRTTACTTCMDGYSLKSDNTCMKNVDQNTDGCVRTGGTYEKCSSCLAGWYKDGDTCKACPANCTCAAANTCDGCKLSTNFYDQVSTTKSCKTCGVADCLDCSADAAKCAVCKAGFFKESDTKCTPCLANCASCTKADTCDACSAKYFAFTMPPTADGATTLKTEVTFCAACVANCKACTVETDGAQACTECNAGYYLNGKNCANADCAGTDGKVCNRCTYGFILKDGKCADCKADNSCPASCTPTTGGPTGGPAAGNNTTSATDSGSKIAFSLLVLAFFAILGHMMI